MFLSHVEIIMVMLGMIILSTLVFTSSIANARLTRERNAWRRYATYTPHEKALVEAQECSCSGECGKDN